MANHYEIPSWAGKAPTGHHLDVTKDDKLIQKLMIDEKKCYLFGRNKQLNDFCIDHASCSRVHAALVYHKHLNISYLVDLGSTHGTFIGNLRLESHKPTQLQINSTFHFGASTRYYILRERPSAGSRSDNIIHEDIPMSETGEGALLGLPESETDLDNLTEYNTAHNRRISMLGITDDVKTKKNKNNKRKRRNVTFNDEECIINPEDVDPNVGRFRNLIQTTVIPTKRSRIENNFMGYSTASSSGADMTKHLNPTSFIPHLYQDLPPIGSKFGDKLNDGSIGSNSGHGSLDVNISPSVVPSFGSKLGLLLPDPAPEVAPNPDKIISLTPTPFGMGPQNKMSDNNMEISNPNEPKKKKYAKEQWPGRKPLLSGL
ncbi:nuclear inhibitor of protein phosphatase 1 [Contarinia nasturtii]|uniref:nuclear inhibitor of protein phosphatase 1 n=1 Tax=Contarinia nasturtii TaxID=265458 RepID=UPI0012D3E59F|nr:nuclear inhibitor of protein phosphatase 1 [Contarinia nasturtii]